MTKPITREEIEYICNEAHGVKYLEDSDDKIDRIRAEVLRIITQH